MSTLHSTWEEVAQAEGELPEFLSEEIQRKKVERTKN